jgi:hypothetical protein
MRSVVVYFHPDSDIRNLEPAVKKYQEIWRKEGKKIVKAIEKVSGLKFKESFINAIVFQAKFPSQSYPLCLKADYPDERKVSFLIHELTHRLLAGNGIGPQQEKFKSEEEKRLAVHKILYLILYDIWVELYGEKFAKESVKSEIDIPGTEVYKKAWKWALSLSKRERKERFLALMRKARLNHR